ncbi:hypothetical protein C8Q80DRAFT_1124200 [Daedaleopsis nitida]|nr:hypothetical protein C8Q80DRAFT_1124200 [Daedaleopsis nitida]
MSKVPGQPNHEPPITGTAPGSSSSLISTSAFIRDEALKSTVSMPFDHFLAEFLPIGEGLPKMPFQRGKDLLCPDYRFGSYCDSQYAFLVPEEGDPLYAPRALVVHVEVSAGPDPFADLVDSPTVLGAQKSLSAVAFKALEEYIDQFFAVEQHTHIFLLLVHGSMLRATRWDRSAIVVSETLDFLNPSLDGAFKLASFFYRFSVQTKTSHGCDPTAERVLPGTPDHELMLAAAKHLPTDLALDDERDLSCEDVVRKSLEDDPVYHQRKLSVSVDGDTTRFFLVGRPVTRHTGAHARATRGYVALDCETKQFVWLKDTWRAQRSLIGREGNLLKELNKAEVEHVPTLICHADLGTEQVTYWASCYATRVDGDDSQSEFYYDDDDDEGQQHQSMKLGPASNIGLAATAVETTKDLLTVAHDIVTTHSQAVKRLGMLHCDLSVGNVIVVPTVVLDEARGFKRIELRGMLIDWKFTRAITHLARRRVGDDIGFDNLGYLSVACLDDRLRIPRIPDELESLVYVLFKIAVITLRHGLLRDGRLVHQLLLLLTFDRVVCADGVGWHRASGKPKRDFVTAHGYNTTAGANRNGVGAFLGDAHPIDELFRVCLYWTQARYRIEDWDATTKRSPSQNEVYARGRCVSRPTLDDRATARKLYSHEAVLEALSRAREKAEDYVIGKGVHCDVQVLSAIDINNEVGGSSGRLRLKFESAEAQGPPAFRRQNIDQGGDDENDAEEPGRRSNPWPRNRTLRVRMIKPDAVC